MRGAPGSRDAAALSHFKTALSTGARLLSAVCSREGHLCGAESPARLKVGAEVLPAAGLRVRAGLLGAALQGLSLKANR